MSEVIQTENVKKEKKGAGIVVIVIIILAVLLIVGCCFGGCMAGILGPKYLQYQEKARISNDRMITKDLIDKLEGIIADPTIGPDPDVNSYLILKIDQNGRYWIEDADGNNMTSLEQELKKQYGSSVLNYSSNQFRSVTSSCTFQWHSATDSWTRIEYGAVAY